ncbi:glucosamine-6-phosphate deaminase [Clostridium sp. USBA 49]|jgi:glucosamine-6-phosphate deaminase|uniref:glucosamine-6-phosphate deaminase n=1 Tax=Clostridium TaxID=1485 RepID=UPI00099ACFED|nr:MULTISPECIES: glucosamine-6-phosphate deaminase [Clostridium]SKA77931.1 glucosamine-6-phosphate deaminase [Clostridium sp. USBA 49]
MKVIVADNYNEMSKIAANEIAKLLYVKPNAVLGLATGSTPEGVYKELVKLNKEHKVDFSQVTSFNLDEYRGLKGDHPQSYRYFMDINLFNHVNIDKNKTHIPNGVAEDIEKECREYDEAIEKAGGIDLQLLGIGTNGHIGFNEPSDYLNLNTHLTDLTKETIKANSRFFENIEEVPTQAITMGLGSIMKAKKIILLASGKKKAEIIAKLVEDKISTKVPASILQVHPDVLVIVDKEAASLLKHNSNNEIKYV